MPEKEDVATVLGRLKEEVRRQRPKDHQGLSPQQTVDLRRVYATSHVNPQFPIGWPRLPPGILPKVAAIAQKIVRRLLRWYINPIVEQQNAFNSAVAAVLESLVIQLEGVVPLVEQLQREHEVARLRLQRLERSMDRSQTPVTRTVSSTDYAAVPPDAPALDYFRLELEFRGSPELIKDRQRAYLKYFLGRQNILDIGCGRGEFVELLIENDTSARGVDLDPDAIAYGHERNLPVELAEALSYLGSLSDESLGGIFCAQVVEHLGPNQLMRLLELCHDKLEPGAPVVIETINPTSLHALSNAFLKDPTHVWPIHPETLQFMMESAGFLNTQLEFLSPVPLANKLLALPDHAQLHAIDPAAASLFNRNAEVVNRTLFGYQDYATIAWRPQDLGDGA